MKALVCLLCVVFLCEHTVAQRNLRSLDAVVTTLDVLPTPMGPRPVTSLGGPANRWGDVGNDGTVVFGAGLGTTGGYFRTRSGGFELVILGGTTTPSIPGYTISTFPHTPEVLNDGSVVLRAQLIPPGRPESQTAWLFDGELRLLARGNDLIPGTNSTFGGLSHIRSSQRGDVAWFLSRANPGETTLFVVNSGLISSVVAEGDPAVGVPGATHSQLLLPSASTVNGDTVYISTTPLGAAATWVSDPAGDRLVLYPGLTPTPPIGGEVGTFLTGDIYFGGLGQRAVTAASVDLGSQTVAGVWAYNGVTFETVLLDGDPVDPNDPNSPTMEPLGGSAQPQAATSEGRIHVFTHLRRGSVVRNAFLSGDEHGLNVVMFNDDPSPLGPPSETAGVEEWTSNDVGQVAAVLKMGGSGVTTENDRVIAVWSPWEGWTQVLRKGDPIVLGPVSGTITKVPGDSGGSTMNLNDRGQLLLGIEVDGVQALVLAKVIPCYPDCDSSGSPDIFDFLCFQDLFVVNDSAADCDESGGLDIFDFLCFQDAFAMGCP